jgi:hypothetical protein
VVVFHEKEGRRHCHAVWSRIDAETMTAKPMSFYKNKLREVSRQLYLENGWQMPRGLIDPKDRDPRNFTLDEWQQAKRSGRNAGDLKEMIQEAWATSDSGTTFSHALEERGLYLARGDRRGHVAVTFEGEVISIALANDGQHQDTGAKMIHAANNTTSNVVSKSISVGEGRSTYRGQVHIPKHLKGCKNNTECDALLINSNSRTDTYPAITVRGNDHVTQHEASVSQVSEEMLFYMQQRGIGEAEAMSLAVNGFINDLVREFPMEYSVELKRLIELEMEGSVG